MDTRYLRFHARPPKQRLGIPLSWKRVSRYGQVLWVFRLLPVRVPRFHVAFDSPFQEQNMISQERGSCTVLFLLRVLTADTVSDFMGRKRGRRRDAGTKQHRQNINTVAQCGLGDSFVK